MSKEESLGRYGSGVMVKFAWPSLSVHGSLVGASGRGGISDAGINGLWRGCRWKEETEGLVESGGDGREWICGDVMGVCATEGESGSATVGDCKGDWKGTSLR